MPRPGLKDLAAGPTYMSSKHPGVPRLRKTETTPTLPTERIPRSDLPKSGNEEHPYLYLEVYAAKKYL